MYASDEELTRLPISEQAGLIERGELDAVELTEAYLRRIDALEPELNAYVTVTADMARATAAERSAQHAAGQHLGPLHGIPLGLKDLYDVAGVPTTAGSGMLRENVPAGDCTVATRLRAAGAVLLGKHATHEFAWGGTTNNPHFGPTHNPHDHSRIPGGSSGGSAASVVAGTSAGSFGSDTCGSIRIPAALCGCVGLKPTYGRISLHRVIPLSDRLDHAGPITRTVRDAALLYMTVAGFDAADARTLPIAVEDVLTNLDDGVSGLRVGRLRGWYEQVLDPGVRAAVDRAAEALADAGAKVVDITTALPDSPLEDVFTCVAADGVPYHWARFGRDAVGYSEALAGVLSAGAPSAEDVAAAREALAVEIEALQTAFAQQADLLLCATQPAPAPPIGTEIMSVDGADLPIEMVLTRLTSIFDAARVPALSVPFGADGGGLPYGVQIIGRHLDEATVLRAGRVLERAG